MSLYHGENIHYRYDTASESVFENISFEISNKSIGLVGKNGCGKTTLIKMLLGILSPVQGKLTIKSGIRTAYLPQDFFCMEKITVQSFLMQANPKLHALFCSMQYMGDKTDEDITQIITEYTEGEGYQFETKLACQADVFRLTHTLDRDFSSLSGGEKTRAALCRLMLTEPDILLLDEPTNHLDAETLSWLENYLSALSVPFVVISHDRAFLNACVQTIWELTSDRIREYSGNYSFYQAQKKLEEEQAIAQYERQQKKVKQLKSAKNEKMHTAHRFENYKIPRSVKKNGGLCKMDYGSRNTSLSISKIARNAAALETRIEKIIQSEEAKKPFIEKKHKIIFECETLKNRFILTADNIGKSYSDPLFENLDISVRAQDRILITGKNGSGKTTLLKILAGILAPDQGSVWHAPQLVSGYYSQEHENLNPENSILDEVTGGNTLIEQQARTMLGCLFISGDSVHKKIHQLSPGEKSKTALARILLTGAHLLILDEPTNHLELEARQALEEALMNYSGAVIFVSHDRYFAKTLAQTTLNLAA